MLPLHIFLLNLQYKVRMPDYIRYPHRFTYI